MATIEELLDKVSALLGRRTLTLNEMQNWWAGTPTGGPNGDGLYPMTDSTGYVTMQPCPARMALEAAKFGSVTRNGPGPFTLTAADAGKLHKIGNGSATTNISVRLTNLPVDTQMMFYQSGSGRLVFSAVSGQIQHRQSYQRTAGLYALTCAVVVGIDGNGNSIWALGGDMSSLTA